MRWVRTYTRSPEHTLGCGRAVVWDKAHCDPFYLDDLNYLPLFQAMTCDTTVIEWDMAISLEDRRAFEAHAAASPGLVQVAPYRHYQFDCEWVHRHPDGTGIKEGEDSAELFGFGLIYFPLWVIRAFLADLSRPPAELSAARGTNVALWAATWHITDVSFAAWHWQAMGHAVPVHWDVRPVHLHYEV